jgi:hypothetical protein
MVLSCKIKITQFGTVNTLISDIFYPHAVPVLRNTTKPHNSTNSVDEYRLYLKHDASYFICWILESLEVMKRSWMCCTIHCRHTNLRCWVTVATEFCTALPNICGSPVWNLLHAIFLVPRIFGGAHNLENLCPPAVYSWTEDNGRSKVECDVLYIAEQKTAPTLIWIPPKKHILCWGTSKIS